MGLMQCGNGWRVSVELEALAGLAEDTVGAAAELDSA